MKKEIKIGIISSLVASCFFVYFCVPILNFLGNIFLAMTNFISSNMMNRLYQEIAIGKTDYSQIMITCVCIGAVVYTTYILLAKIFSRDKSSIPRSRNIKLKYIIVSLILFLNISLLTVFLIMSNLKSQAINSFNQNIKIISPYIDEQKEEMLFSKFSQMQNLEDYKSVINELNKIAFENDIELPKPKIHFY